MDAAAMYYLWLNEAQVGPYTLGQLQSMWNTGQLTANNLFWQEGEANWKPLLEILSRLEPKPQRITSTEQVTEVAPMPRPRPRAVIAAAAPVYADDTRLAPRLLSNAERNIWEGNPTAWHFAAHIILGIVTIPLLIGLLILLYVYFQIAFTQYTITNKRVSIKTGILVKNEQELRIQDIRSIAARRNIFGVGVVEFSSAARADAEVIFYGLWDAASIRDMVKGLQN